MAPNSPLSRLRERERSRPEKPVHQGSIVREQARSYGEQSPGQPSNPCNFACATAWVRRSVPSLPLMFQAWDFTVLTDRQS